MEIIGALAALVGALIALAAIVVLGWVLPITLGLRMADRKRYSRLWMLFGIHPVGGWIAYIVLACLPPRVQCPNCGGFVRPNFRLCPFCHIELASPSAQAPAPRCP